MGLWATLNNDVRAQLPENTAFGEFNLPIGPAGSAARLTTSQAADLAKWLGYGQRVKDAPFNSMGQAVFTNGRYFISLDVTMHAGAEATWKLFSRRGQRIGTYNFDLTTRLGQ